MSAPGILLSFLLPPHHRLRPSPRDLQRALHTRPARRGHPTALQIGSPTSWDPNPKPYGLRPNPSATALLRRTKLPASPWTGHPAAPQPRPSPASVPPRCQEAPRGLHPRPRPVQRSELRQGPPLVRRSATSIPHRWCFPDRLNPRSTSAGAPRANLWGSEARRRPASTLPASAAPSPPPVNVADSPAWPSSPDQALGEHQRVPLILLVLDVVDHSPCSGWNAARR
jgi:hypothetical protein